MVFEMLKQHLIDDDKELQKIYDNYKSGAMTTGELKQIGIEKMEKFMKDFEANIEKARNQVDSLNFINQYYFWSGIVVFAGYLFLHRLAAKIYASGILKLLKNEKLAVTDLQGIEKDILLNLELDKIEKIAPSHIVKRVFWNTNSFVFRMACAVFTFLLWFAFVAQIYTREFFFYHENQGWLNQPLLQLPSVKYIPNRLEEEVAEELAASIRDI